MIKSRFSYLKLSAVVAVLAIAIIGLNGLLSGTTTAREKSTTTPGETGLTLEQKFSERATTVLAAERDTTTPTLAPVDSCSFGGVQVTAVNLTQDNLVDRIEVGWDFTMPQQLAPLGTCATVDHFDVQVDLTFRNGSRKTKSENASPLARNAIFRFTDVLRDVKKVQALVKVQYKFNAISTVVLAKEF